MTYDCREAAAAALESFVVQPRDCNLTSYHESFSGRTFNSTPGKRWTSRLTFCEPQVFDLGGGFRGGFHFDEPPSGHEIIWNALSSLPSLLIISPWTPWSIFRYLIVLHFSNNDQCPFTTRLCRIVCEMPGSWWAASAMDLQSCTLKSTQWAETKKLS